MTPAGLPPEHLLSAWHRRFPDRRNLWAGRLRLWRVELPVRPPSLLAEWVARAAADTPPAAAARRFGLPAAAGTGQPTRRPFAFLDLPGGPLSVSVPLAAFRPWPEPVTTVPRTADWRTIPVVRAEAVDVVAVRLDGAITVYPADGVEAGPLWELPADALPAAGPEQWATAVPSGGWRWVGDGPLYEGAFEGPLSQ